VAAETPSATGDNKNDNTNTPTVFTTECLLWGQVGITPSNARTRITSSTAPKVI
jgi:hypothetical protein